MAAWISVGEDRIYNLRDVREVVIRENHEKNTWEIFAIPFGADRDFEDDLKKKPLLSFHGKAEADIVLRKIKKELGLR